MSESKLPTRMDVEARLAEMRAKAEGRKAEAEAEADGKYTLAKKFPVDVADDFRKTLKGISPTVWLEMTVLSAVYDFRKVKAEAGSKK